MNEEVGVVAPGVLAQVVLQVAYRLVGGVAPAFPLQCGYGLQPVAEPLRDLVDGLRVDIVLLAPVAVAAAFGHGQRAVLEGDRDRPSVGVPRCLIDQRHEEPLVALHVVLLDVGVLEPEAHCHAVGGGPVVVAEVLGGLDVVLVAVRPVQVHLLAVVGDGVPLIPAVPPPGDEVPVLVVPAEERVQVVVGIGFDSLPAPAGLCRRLGLQVVLAARSAGVPVIQVAVRVDRVSAEVLDDYLSRSLQVGHGLRLPGQVAGLKIGGYARGQLIDNEALDGIPLVVHDAIDAEVQVRAVELEQLAQQALELREMSFAGDGLACHDAIPPGSPGPPISGWARMYLPPVGQRNQVRERLLALRWASL